MKQLWGGYLHTAKEEKVIENLKSKKKTQQLVKRKCIYHSKIFCCARNELIEDD